MEKFITISINILILCLTPSYLMGQGWEYYNTTNSGISSNYVSTFTFSSDNVLWVGTQDKGLARFDGNNWKSYDTNNSGIPSNNVTNIVVGLNNELWVTTYVL